MCLLAASAEPSSRSGRHVNARPQACIHRFSEEDVLTRFFEISVLETLFASDTDVPYLLEWVEHFISP